MENAPQYNNETSLEQQPVSNQWEKMAKEAIANGPNDEAAEKKFYETETEFTMEGIRDFRDELFNATPDEAKKIVESRIALLEERADKVDIIGPADSSRRYQQIHRGYISKDTTVHFESFIGSEYRVKNTDYLYDAVEYLRDNKDNIQNGHYLFNRLHGFIESYFGDFPESGVDRRWDIIEEKTGASAQDYEEGSYEIADISVLKGKHTAMCSEFSVMAQNLMSLFGYETYLVIGDVSVDGRKEDHAYNVVINNGGKKVLLDYSITSSIRKDDTIQKIPTRQTIEDGDPLAVGSHIKAYTCVKVIHDDGEVTYERGHKLEYGIK